MRARFLVFEAAALALAACNQPVAEQSMSNAMQVRLSPVHEGQPPIPPPGTGPDARTPFGEVKGLIDPTSREAATRLVHDFADLLNARKFEDAYRLLRPGARPRDQFVESFAKIDPLRVTVGAAGRPEGAAGSIYMSVPLTISGVRHKRVIREHALVFVRRVNNVPGATEAQREWHISNINWPD